MALRRFLFLAVFAIFAAGMIFGAGGAQSQGPQTTADGRTILQVGIQTNAFITDYKDNYLTQLLESRWNVDLDMLLLPSEGNDVRTRVSLMVAAGDLPDFFLTNSLSMEQIFDYGSNGAFIALNNYFNNPALAPNWTRIRQSDKDVMLNAMTQADGNIYSFPNYEPNLWNETPHRYYINQIWLDRLGLSIPTTTDELKQVLIAFRDRDPNQNGRRDEIGIYGRVDGGYGENVIAALMNSFIFYNRNSLSLDPTGRTVIAPFTEPAFRQGLQFLNDLFREGLLQASVFTDDQTHYRQILNTFPNIAGVVTAGSLGHWPGRENNPSLQEMYLIPPFVGPNGVNYTPYDVYSPSQRAMITSRSRVPETVFRILESFMDIELSIITRSGEEHVNWTRDPALVSTISNAYIELGLYPAITVGQLAPNIWATPSRQFWHNMSPRYYPEEWENTRGSLESPFDPDDRLSMVNALNFQWYRGKHPEQVLPLLRFTNDEAIRIGADIATINEFVRQTMAEFTTGTRDINSDAAWNSYLNDLNRMGLPAWISTAQTAFNRQRR